jgi:hypothetical protein
VTRTVCLSLGFSSVSGKQAVDQVQRFKCQLSSLLKKPDGVTLLTVEDVETRCRGVTAVYDADNGEAAAWAKQAEAISGELWRVLAERRKGPAR